MIQIIEEYLEKIFGNKLSAVIFSMILIFYGSKIAAPKLNNFALNHFKSIFFKVFVLSLIVYKGVSDKFYLKISNKVIFSLTISSLFILAMEYLEKGSIDLNSLEKFADEYPECKNRPETGKTVTSYDKKTDGYCAFFYSPKKYHPIECGLVTEGVKFCANPPDPLPDEKVTGCYKFEENENDYCSYTYEKK